MKVPKGMFSRSKEFLSLSTKLVSEELKARVSASTAGTNLTSTLTARIAQAEALVSKLGLLRGAALKAGQLISTELAELLPPELAPILARLHDKAVSVSFSEVESVLTQDLGSDWRKQLLNLDSNAAAAASIGQVHRAEFQGKPVAVKIQYPGIAEAIDSDLSVLKTIVNTFIAVTGRKMSMDGFFEEVQRVLKQEVDYTKEAEFQNRYRGLLLADPRFEVPQVYAGISSRRVLVTEWLDGISFAQWLEMKPSDEDRHRVALSILDLFFLEFYEWGLVQTDPNQGNFRIRLEPLQLQVLDFGATVVYTKDFIRSYAQLLVSIETESPENILKKSYEMGFLSEKEAPEVKALFLKMLKESIEPFFSKEPEFRFQNDEYNIRMRNTVQEFIGTLKYSAPPRVILFLHRKLGGVFQLLRMLDVGMNLVPYWEQMRKVSQRN